MIPFARHLPCLPLVVPNQLKYETLYGYHNTKFNMVISTKSEYNTCCIVIVSKTCKSLLHLKAKRQYFFIYTFIYTGYIYTCKAQYKLIQNINILFLLEALLVKLTYSLDKYIKRNIQLKK